MPSGDIISPEESDTRVNPYLIFPIRSVWDLTSWVILIDANEEILTEDHRWIVLLSEWSKATWEEEETVGEQLYYMDFEWSVRNGVGIPQKGSC